MDTEGVLGWIHEGGIMSDSRGGIRLDTEGYKVVYQREY